MKLQLDHFDSVSEKILLISIIGVINSLQCEAISVEEAEKFLFSPHLLKFLYNKKCNKKIIDIVESGCEIEDIVSLLPGRLNYTLENIKKETIDLLKQYDDVDDEFWIN